MRSRESGNGSGHQPVTTTNSHSKKNEQSDSHTQTKKEKKAIFQKDNALANKLEKLLIIAARSNGVEFVKKQQKIKEIIRVIFLQRHFERAKPPLVGRF